eukprot:GDKI01042461.1.p1 GENE.GDKI01042461.1~~GDKI01042461.1.p1  ORF type:complete len:196 (+),score=32.77 GDKI01042461.1:156-743(+)
MSQQGARPVGGANVRANYGSFPEKNETPMNKRKSMVQTVNKESRGVGPLFDALFLIATIAVLAMHRPEECDKNANLYWFLVGVVLLYLCNVCISAVSAFFTHTEYNSAMMDMVFLFLKIGGLCWVVVGGVWFVKAESCHIDITRMSLVILAAALLYNVIVLIGLACASCAGKRGGQGEDRLLDAENSQEVDEGRV